MAARGNPQKRVHAQRFHLALLQHAAGDIFFLRQFLRVGGQNARRHFVGRRRNQIAGKANRVRNDVCLLNNILNPGIIRRAGDNFQLQKILQIVLFNGFVGCVLIQAKARAFRHRRNNFFFFVRQKIRVKGCCRFFDLQTAQMLHGFGESPADFFQIQFASFAQARQRDSFGWLETPGINHQYL